MATESCAKSWQRILEEQSPYARLVTMGWLILNPDSRPAEYCLEEALEANHRNKIYRTVVESWAKDKLRDALQTAGVFGTAAYKKDGSIPGSENITQGLDLNYPAWIAFYLWFAHDDSSRWRHDYRTRLINDIGVLYHTGEQDKISGRFRLTLLPNIDDEVTSELDDRDSFRFKLSCSCTGLFEAASAIESTFEKAHILVRNRNGQEGLHGIVENLDRHHSIPNTLVISVTETVLKAVSVSPGKSSAIR